MAITDSNKIENLATSQEAIISELFGVCPEDVISPIKCAADALSWLEEIFRTIALDASGESGNIRIKNLANAGAYLAFDMNNYAGCQYEDFLERLKVAGVAHPSAEASHV